VLVHAGRRDQGAFRSLTGTSLHVVYVITKTGKACANSDTVADHFAEITEMVGIGPVATPVIW